MRNKKTGKKLVSLLMSLALILSSGVVSNAKSTVLENELTVPGENCINVGIKGTYMAEQQAALDRINQIRKEACEKGYPDPRDKSQKLTSSDYVPIKWSYELERYARIRAAEATVYPDHGRPGKNVYKDSNNRYMTGNGEVLAWPGGTLKGGVNQWYGEKETWVSGGSGVTGHYTSMIDPDNRYVGLGGFIADDGLGSSWGACVCGRFSEGSEGTTINETMAPELQNIIQVISIKQDYLSAPVLQQTDGFDNGNKTIILYAGEDTTVKVVRNLSFDATAIGVTSAVVLDLGSYTFSSSNKKIAAVNSDGRVTAKKIGKTEINASSSDGKTYSVSVTVKQYLGTPKIKKTSRNKNKLKVEFNVSKSTALKTIKFQIQVAKNKKFTKGLIKGNCAPKYESWYKIATKYTKQIKKLKKKGTYYVRVRAYAKYDEKKYYSQWSKVKKVKSF